MARGQEQDHFSAAHEPRRARQLGQRKNLRRLCCSEFPERNAQPRKRHEISHGCSQSGALPARRGDGDQIPGSQSADEREPGRKIRHAHGGRTPQVSDRIRKDRARGHPEGHQQRGLQTGKRRRESGGHPQPVYRCDCKRKEADAARRRRHSGLDDEKQGHGRRERRIQGDARHGKGRAAGGQAHENRQCAAVCPENRREQARRRQSHAQHHGAAAQRGHTG